MEEKELVGCNGRYWEDPYNTQWPTSVAPSTDSLTQEDAVTLVNSGDEPSCLGSQHSTVAVLIPHRVSGWETGIVRQSEGKKYLFPRAYAPSLAYASGGNLLIYEALQEDIGFPDEVVASIPPWPRFWNLEEAQPTNWRGAFYPTYNRKVLFSKTMTLRTSALLRWKPNVTIQMRSIESEDD